ncbi:hypothetical protein GIB67_040607 [Kingdonia uniflora]|uniref:F-box associated domain-containing protein n=1 Tax=Kingdonia uniflora TaxID=39325 RepID=A0A7J7M982_9MAGN|nr:hypothetical protein GIB67_040607 [Kingdonia uniflora]
MNLYHAHVYTKDCDASEDGAVEITYPLHTPFYEMEILSDSCNGEAGIFLKGFLHWVASTKNEAFASIVSFDIRTEEFRVMLQASDACGFFCKNNEEIPCSDVMSGKSLGVLGGCLCIFNKSYTMNFVVLVMRDYGLKESWTQLYPDVEETSGYSSPYSLSSEDALCKLNDSARARDICASWELGSRFITPAPVYSWQPLPIACQLTLFFSVLMEPSVINMEGMDVYFVIWKLITLPVIMVGSKFSVLSHDMQAIYICLALGIQMGYKRVAVATDSKLMVSYFKDNTELPHSCHVSSLKMMLGEGLLEFRIWWRQNPLRKMGKEKKRAMPNLPEEIMKK